MFWFGVLFTGSPQQRRRYEKSCKLTHEGTAFSFFIEHHYTINAVHPKKETLPDWVIGFTIFFRDPLYFHIVGRSIHHLDRWLVVDSYG